MPLGKPFVPPPVTPNQVMINYTNWKGNRRWRRILPVGIVFRQDGYHPNPQWMIEAYDMEEAGTLMSKFFPVVNIHEWKAYDGIGYG